MCNLFEPAANFMWFVTEDAEVLLPVLLAVTCRSTCHIICMEEGGIKQLTQTEATTQMLNFTVAGTQASAEFDRR